MLVHSLSAQWEALGPPWVPDYPGHAGQRNRTPLHLSPNLEAPPQKPLLSQGSLGKGPGHGSPQGRRESPALSAWPLQDITSSLMGQLGPRPTDCAGNVRLVPLAPADRELQTSRSHGLGLHPHHPEWPGGQRDPAGDTGPPSLGAGVLAHREAEDGKGRVGSGRGLSCGRSAGSRRTQRKRLVGEQQAWPRADVAPRPPPTPPQRVPRGGAGRSLTA